MGKTPAKNPSSPSRSSTVTAFCHRGGAAAKALAKATFNEKKALTPADWKDDFVKDDRWVGYLPEDWTPGLKMTEGGILIKVYVGPAPERKHFFHKVDLEKYLGRSLSNEERGQKPPAWDGIDPKKFIKRRETEASAEYLNKRCDAVHGLSVEEAVETEHEHTHGKTRKYSITDLKYDLKCSRIELVDERPSQSSRPTISAPARRVPATPKQPIPGTPKISATATRIPSTPISTKRTAASSTPPRVKRQRTSSVAPAVVANKTMAAKVFDSCYATLKSKPASNVTDETNIYTMIGIGTTLGLEGPMLSMLPELLRKAPAERGASMQFVLDQFQQAFAR